MPDDATLIYVFFTPGSHLSSVSDLFNLLYLDPGIPERSINVGASKLPPSAILRPSDCVCRISPLCNCLNLYEIGDVRIYFTRSRNRLEIIVLQSQIPRAIHNCFRPIKQLHLLSSPLNVLLSFINPTCSSPCFTSYPLHPLSTLWGPRPLSILQSRSLPTK